MAGTDAEKIEALEQRIKNIKYARQKALDLLEIVGKADVKGYDVERAAQAMSWLREVAKDLKLQVSGTEREIENINNTKEGVPCEVPSTIAEEVANG